MLDQIPNHTHEDNRCCFCGVEDDYECITCPDFDKAAAMETKREEMKGYLLVQIGPISIYLFPWKVEVDWEV